jgi:hypothetical protein
VRHHGGEGRSDGHAVPRVSLAFPGARSRTPQVSWAETSAGFCGRLRPRRCCRCARRGDEGDIARCLRLALHGAGGVAGSCSLLTISGGRSSGVAWSSRAVCGRCRWQSCAITRCTLTALQMRCWEAAAKAGDALVPMQGIQKHRAVSCFKGAWAQPALSRQRDTETEVVRAWLAAAFPEDVQDQEAPGQEAEAEPPHPAVDPPAYRQHHPVRAPVYECASAQSVSDPPLVHAPDLRVRVAAWCTQQQPRCVVMGRCSLHATCSVTHHTEAERWLDVIARTQAAESDAFDSIQVVGADEADAGVGCRSYNAKRRHWRRTKLGM